MRINVSFTRRWSFINRVTHYKNISLNFKFLSNQKWLSIFLFIFWFYLTLKILFQKAHKMTIESWWLRHIWLYLNRVLLMKHQSNQMFSKLYVWLVSSDETQVVLYVSKRQFCIDSLMHIQTWSTENATLFVSRTCHLKSWAAIKNLGHT